MKGIVAENARELAVMINESLKTRERRYTLRPFNRFDIERSMWWIVPSADYPAFRFGKFFVDEVNGKFEVGLHIEKGLIQSIDNKPELVLNDTWAWYVFIDALANREVGERLTTIQESVGNDIGIAVRVEIPDLIEAGDERGKRLIQLRQGQWWDEQRKEPADLRILLDWIGSIEGISWY
ncbi:hypothetical protein [Alicyclobacillus tolerans]|uniref:hypothetical protein n=1 Tax=Alicyclobacillus tolerans TaxID=90970 RepID=UPI00101AE7D8|nr:hypothetical protein [Alicyclobacillus montanus]